jgi:plastocyanin
VITISANSGGMSFSPSSASLEVGDAVAWKNKDFSVHAIAQDGCGFSTPSIAPGATSKAITISSSGTLAYHCSIHPSMTGDLMVSP